MGKAGLFQNRSVELIEGEVIDMSPIGSRHATANTIAARAIESFFGDRYFVRWQMPLDGGPYSEPEPDIAVIEGSPRDYIDRHPSTAALIVEVADSSLSFDRNEKASLYARLGILDYWIINLVDNHLEVLREPQPLNTARYGFDYRERQILYRDETITPVAEPQIMIRVGDVLP
jgi:Uma2 family endonuclease